MNVAISETGAALRHPRPSPAPVFVVDDDEAVLDSLQSLLDAEGFEVTSFASATAALTAIEHGPPACLVLDLHMPVVSGLDLMGRLAERGIGVPVVVITGKFDRQTAERARAAGAQAVLRKPFAASELMDAIERALATGHT